MRAMLILCLTLVAVALGSSSCGRKGDALEVPTPEGHAPIPEPIPNVTDSNSAPRLALPPAENLDATLAQLTREVRKWIVRHQRPPKSFEEFAASAAVQIPPAPPGKKFALGKQMRVIVVNR